MLEIKNQGQKIVSTNFWDSEMAQEGLFFLSWNAGAARLLVPDGQVPEVREMKTGKLAIISRGRWEEHGRENVDPPGAAEPSKAVSASEAQLAIQKLASPRQVQVIVALGVVGVHNVFDTSLKRHTFGKAIGTRQNHGYSCGAADRMECEA